MRTILLIEDEKPIGDLIKSFLGVEYLVIACITGEAAVNQIGLIMPDLIILDLYLKGSGLTGLDTLSALHNTPGFKDVPIIAISGRASEREIDQAMALGAVKFVKKPYSPARLMFEIETLLGEP